MRWTAKSPPIESDTRLEELEGSHKSPKNSVHHSLRCHESKRLNEHDISIYILAIIYVLWQRQGPCDCWGATTLQDRTPLPFQIPLQAFEGWGSKSVPSKLTLSNCKITVHFLSPVPYKLISRHFRGGLDNLGCMLLYLTFWGSWRSLGG